MNDQAAKLRKIVADMREQRTEENNRTRIITVTSGKGGVGKTNFTANLAIYLQMSGFKVLVLDADFGLSNIDVILGIQAPYNFSHVLNNTRRLSEIITEGPKGIQVISGGSGVYELIHMDAAQLDHVLSDIPFIEPKADVILVDTGAGISDPIIKLICAGQEVILITTPEPTAVMDAYALLKTLTQHPLDHPIRIRLLVNRAETIMEAQEVLNSFTKVAQNFLKLPLEPLGYILADAAVVRSVKKQIPFLLNEPKSAASKQLRDIAVKLMNQPMASNRENELIKFFRRFAGLLRPEERKAGI